jgi:hypothetical protein
MRRSCWMHMINVLTELWMKFKTKSNEVGVRRLEEDEVALVEQLVARDAQVYEVATALDLTETRALYEMKKIKDKNERTRETAGRD